MPRSPYRLGRASVRLASLLAVIAATVVGEASAQVSLPPTGGAELEPPPAQTIIEPRPLASPVAPIDSAVVARQARFDTAVPMAMAAFLREEALWLVFSAEEPLDAPTLARQGELGLGAARVAEARGGVALRFDNVGQRTPMIAQRGTEWVVDLPLTAQTNNSSLEVVAQPDHPDGARLFIEATGATNPVAFVDPIVGDILVAMPLEEAGQGILTPQRFAEFGLLASTLGIVIRTFIDDIRVMPAYGGVAITSERGLQLS